MSTTQQRMSADLEANISGRTESQNWLARLLRKSRPLSKLDEKRFLLEGWAKNKWIIHLFAGIALLHTVYVNVVYSAVYETTAYRNGIMYGLLYPISVTVFLLSFVNPLRTRGLRVLWYSLLSIEGIMMTLQISVKELLCHYDIEDATSCDLRYRPLAELQWVYAIVGPLLLLTMMRNSRPAQLLASLFMFSFIVWSVSTGYNSVTSPFIQWSEVGFAAGANIFALLVAGQRNIDERDIFIKQSANERLQAHLMAEMTEKTVAQQKAAHEEEKRNQFTSYIFHEIRNPLNTIILSMELLDIDEEFHKVLNISAEENLSRMKVALTAIESIINDTLDLRKMNEGKLSLNPRPFDFHRMIHTCIWTMESVWLEKKVSLQTQLDKAISSLPQVIGDETRLHQVLTNYLSNAVKFTPTGGTITLSTALSKSKLIEQLDPARPGLSTTSQESVEASVSSSSRTTTTDLQTVTITVTVKDTGIGITEANQKKLFHEFVQIDPEKNQGGKGTGLGLSICAGIIKSMNGEYGVVSKLNEGASFFFRVAFPLSDKPVVSSEESSAEIRPPRPATKINKDVDRAFKLSILVTDDDSIQRTIMSQLLSRLGHSVDTADDGVNCLEKVAISLAVDKPYDVIFIDNQMPRLTGGDTIRTLRAAGVRTHIISLTATADTDLHDDLRRFGASQILTKPSSKAVIDKALKMVSFSELLPPGREPSPRKAVAAQSI